MAFGTVCFRDIAITPRPSSLPSPQLDWRLYWVTVAERDGAVRVDACLRTLENVLEKTAKKIRKRAMQLMHRSQVGRWGAGGGEERSARRSSRTANRWEAGGGWGLGVG